jgi:hypothetical protein
MSDDFMVKRGAKGEATDVASWIYSEKEGKVSKKGVIKSKEQYDATLHAFEELVRKDPANASLKPEEVRAKALERFAKGDPEDFKLASKRAGLTKRQQEKLTRELPPEIRKGLQQIIARGDVIGFDVAAPEKYGFSGRGMRNFEDMYDILMRRASAASRSCSGRTSARATRRTIRGPASRASRRTTR